VTFDAMYIPASDEAQIGGDWYDAVRLFDGRIVISIGDVVGKGSVAVHADPALIFDAADRAFGVLDRRDLGVRVGRSSTAALHRRSNGQRGMILMVSRRGLDAARTSP
jgi:hypothetical protein